jgi:hypothetical protein
MRRTAILAPLALLMAGCSPQPSEESPPSPVVQSPTTVGEVMTSDPGFPQTGRQVVDAGGTVTVQVVSRADVEADVTLRFLVAGLVVHLARLHVLPHSETQVIGPDVAARVEVGGTYEDGSLIPPAAFTYGLDFDAGTAAVYYLSNPSGLNSPPAVSVVEPADDVVVDRGGSLLIAWADDDPDDNALIVAYLDGNGVALDGDEIRLTPAIDEDPDGPGNDEALVGIPVTAMPGTYHVLLTTSDGHAIVTAFSKGSVTISATTRNDTLALSILIPSGAVTVTAGNPLAVSWTDRDDEDKATVQFFLVSTGRTFPNGSEIPLGQPFAAGPDGAGDQGSLPTSGVTPGKYDLYGVISSGSLSLTAKAPGAITIAASPSQAPRPPCAGPPTLVGVSPSYGGYNVVVNVTVTGSHFVPGSTTMRLTKAGQTPIMGTNVLIPDDQRGSCDFNLDGAAPGAWDLEVSVAGCGDATLPGAFTVGQPGDFDGDNDVDETDYLVFEACMNGPNRPTPPRSTFDCHQADFDLDHDVDLADFIFYFQRCFNGPNAPGRCS